MKYEIRKDGRVYARWEAEAYTPDRETLKTMKQAGYRLYINGRMQKI